MRITLTYQETRETAPCEKVLAPEEYYDPIESGETYLEDGIPIYNDLRCYVGPMPPALDWIEVRITHPLGIRHVRTDYSLSKSNSLTYVREEHADKPTYEELIITNQIEQNVCNIMRISREDLKPWACHLNSVITEELDGSEDEKCLEGWGPQEGSN